MIAEKTNTAQRIIEQVSPAAPKVGYFNEALVARSLRQIEEKGIPTGRHEDYKYCNIDAVLRKEFPALSQEFRDVRDVAPYRLEDTITLVVQNGRYSASLSDKVILNGLHISVLADDDHPIRPGSVADVESDSFIALNTAFCSGGFTLTVEKGVEMRIPIHILYISSSDTSSMVNPRSMIRLEDGATATIIEHHVNAGTGKVFQNHLSEKVVGKSARLEYFILQEEGEKGFSVNTSQVQVMDNGNYDCTTVTLSGHLVRNNHNVVLKGQNCSAHLYGLFSAEGSQLVDNHTLMDHQVPNCESNELYKGIASGKATGVFNGKIFVRQDAQKTNAYQSSKNILLSDDATIYTKPQLEIYANDVKCSHGTSTGKVDEEALFYLKSRGIGEGSARKLLLSSFAGEILSRISVDSLKDRVTAAFESGLRL